MGPSAPFNTLVGLFLEEANFAKVSSVMTVTSAPVSKTNGIMIPFTHSCTTKSGLFLDLMVFIVTELLVTTLRGAVLSSQNDSSDSVSESF